MNKAAQRGWRDGAFSAAVRGAALFLGGFLLVAVMARLLSGGRVDRVVWVLDLRWLPATAAMVMAGGIGAVLVGFAVAPRVPVVRRIAVVAAGLAGLVAAVNAANVLRLNWVGHIAMAWPVPLSVLFAGMFAGVALVAARGASSMVNRSPRRRIVELGAVICAAAGWAVVWSVSQMVVFGKTDYRRPGAMAVVFGSRVYADGRLSDALADRVRTACDLHASGLAPVLVMSGGPGDGGIHEAEAMRQFAMAQGVPEGAIVLDFEGLNTAATVRNVRDMVASKEPGRVLMVSHGYHLPRIKQECDRVGLDAVTVPARESYLLTEMPLFMAREVAAQWVYLARGLTGLLSR